MGTARNLALHPLTLFNASFVCLGTVEAEDVERKPEEAFRSPFDGFCANAVECSTGIVEEPPVANGESKEPYDLLK